VCWNCGEKGHFKDKCPKPVKDTKKDSPKRSGSANTAVEDNLEDEAAFFVEGNKEFDDDLPEPCTVSDSDSEGLDSELDGDSESDWFSEVGDDDEGSCWKTEELFEADGSKCGLLVSVDSNLVASYLDETAANVDASSVTDHVPRVKVFDSGCTRHITPYRDTIHNFVKISLKLF
jgi:hypothetical protein